MGLYSDKEIVKSIMETNYVINRDIVRFENISKKYPKKKIKMQLYSIPHWNQPG